MDDRLGGDNAVGAASVWPTRVYLVRHGQTELNAAGLIRGLLDPPLDKVGHLQAQEVGAALARLAPRAVVSGPLRRTVETAHAIASSSEAPLSVDRRLQDRDYGEWTGKSVRSVQEQWGSLDDAPGVELWTEVAARALQALEALYDENAPRPVVVVTHDAVVRALLMTWGRVRGADSVVDPGSYSVVERSADGWRVLSVNNHVG